MLIPLILIGLVDISESYAHTSVKVEQYEIEVGWSIEPPVTGIRNDIVFKIIERGEIEGTYSGITSAFKNMDATIMYGGETKQINLNSDPRLGYYFSPIIPTKTGTYQVELKGEIRETTVNVKIPIEDVESTDVLDFPTSQIFDATKMQNKILSLENQIKHLNKITPKDNNNNYDLEVFALSIACSAIVLSVVSMMKRR